MVILLLVLLAVVCINLAVVIYLIFSVPEKAGPVSATTVATAIPSERIPETTREAPMEEPGETEALTESEPASEERTYLPELAEKRAENGDLVGWLTIEGTRIDYPVMYTPEDPEKYLHLGFDQNYSFAGLPFIDAHCSLNPESDNLIIYAHNMLDGSMFRSLMKYEEKTYWQAHPTIRLDLVDEEREYEVLAAFRDRVYYKTETCFKFYQFINADSQERFQEAMDYYAAHSAYDTGVTAEYGDRLITLVTCAYHTDNGRFVVVARQKQ